MIAFRHVQPSDFDEVHAVLNEWWGGRDMASLLPRLFFDHFSNTSFIAEEDGDLVAFLIGFLSQSHSDEAYIHFVGVHPDCRKKGLARQLYQQFFDLVQQSGRTIVRCITSPVNEKSIAFHKRMGFIIEAGDGEVNGVPVKKNYGGTGKDRVLFKLELDT